MHSNPNEKLIARSSLISILGLAILLLPACGGAGSSGAPPPMPSPSPSPSPCNHTGVSGIPGAYTFAPLHVSNTRIADSGGCEIYLVGTNDGSAFEGDAGGITAGWRSVVATLRTNVSRVSINTRWWFANRPVPRQQGILYQAWISKIVQTLEGDGLYVELDATTNFWEDPCPLNGGPNCPSEDQGEIDYQSALNSGNQQQIAYYYQGLAVYTPISIQALTSLAQTFGSDPAILFDVWNEPADYAFAKLSPDDPNGANNFLSNMNARIAAVNANAPNSLVVVYDKDPTMQNNGKWYTGKNLVLDSHMYNQAYSFGGNAPAWVAWAHQNGAAAIVNEFGSQNGPPPAKSDPSWQQFSAYVNAIGSMGIAEHVGIVFWNGGYVTQSGLQNLPLSDAGTLFTSLSNAYFSQ